MLRPDERINKILTFHADFQLPAVLDGASDIISEDIVNAFWGDDL